MYGALIGAAIAGIASIISSAVTSREQKKSNQQLAEFQASANEKYQLAQNKYNSPQAQMARFSDAGLNPHLIYGQGNPGNQSSPLSYPDIKPTDLSGISKSVSDLLPLINQSRLTDSQVQATDASTMQRTAQAEVSRVQAEVLKRNPLLNDTGFNAIIDGLKASAMLKSNQSKGQLISNLAAPHMLNAQYEKVWKEVQLLEQKYNLGTQDSAIKAEVLKSKEFQNSILEVQKNFMTDSEITPQHIWQFIQLLLMKIL